MLVAYEGEQPYIFVSYSHRNSRYIHGVIEFLQNAGYRVWFDGGIEAGSEWPEYIASHLEGCSCVLTFMSNAFVASDNCKRELHFAQDLKKPLLNVYIEDVNLPAGLRMQLGLCQAMYRDNFRTEGEFLHSLARARILADCRDKAVEAVVMEPVCVEPDAGEETVWSPDSIPADDTDHEALVTYDREIGELEDETDDLPEDEEDSEEEVPMPGSMKLLGWLTILLELSYCLVGPKALEIASATDINGWLLILVMVIPHLAIALVNKLILRIMAGNTKTYHRDDFTMGLFLLCPIVALVASFVGIPSVQYEVAGIVKFLISLGLNIIPAAIVFLMYVLTFGNDGRKK